MNQWNQTMRYPTNDGPTAVSRNDLVAEQLDNSASSFRARLYNLFTNYPDYTTFSNEAWIPANNTEGYDSIESIHDQIHGLTGSGGHMTYIDYSSFDPIFFLHHAMIDRCFAMWQVLYPNSYVVAESAEYSTFTTSAGETQDAQTDLTPFFQNGKGSFWNSNSARSTETFGYAYAETANTSGTTSKQIQARVKAAINSLYGTTAAANIASRVKRRQTSEASNLSKHELYVNSSAGLPDDHYREWVANIRVKKYALNGPFFIHIFLGEFNPDPFSWSFEPNLVGTHCILARSDGAYCVPCSSNEQVTGTIPLTSALLDVISQGKLNGLDPSEVVPFLQQNLAWRVTLVSLKNNFDLFLAACIISNR